MDPDFPLEDVEEIGRRLLARDALIAGWIPPRAGLLDIQALLVGQHIDGFEIIVLPDRNVASRMARIAREGTTGPRDPATQVAVLLMAFAQATNIDIDPGLAFHELAHHTGGNDALEELAWFRTADTANVRQWIDLALERRVSVDLGSAAVPEEHDVAAPPPRWLRNYIVALKIFELELVGGSPVRRIEALLDWMVQDFILAGPAVLYAARAFATHHRRAGMMKGIRSADRAKTLKGAMNAAWDITYLSEFVRQIPAGEVGKRRYILATADQALADIAPVALLGPEPTEDQQSLEQALSAWWHPRDANRISRRLFDGIARIKGRLPPGTDSAVDLIASMIEDGERKLMRWPYTGPGA